MRNISEERFIATKALIQFEDGPLSLCIPRGATWGMFRRSCTTFANGIEAGRSPSTCVSAQWTGTAAPARIPPYPPRILTERIPGYNPVKPLARTP